MKCSKTDVSKHMQNYVGTICLLWNKRNVLVWWVLKPDGGNWGKEYSSSFISAIHGEKPSLVIAQTVTKALNYV